jgi:hypothetical protein
MKIQDLIVKTEKVKWQELKDLQPENLKTNFHSEKTKKSIIELGFAQAIYVWQNPETQELKICDGHLRADLLRELVAEGYQVPEELPCTFLDNTKIKTEKEAIKYLLRVFNVKRNPSDSETLERWLEVMDLSVDEVAFDDLDIKIDMDDIEVEKLETPEEEETEKDFQEMEEGGNARKTMHFTLCGEQIELVNRKIAECKKSEEFNYCETFGNEDQNGNALYCLLSRL